MVLLLLICVLSPAVAAAQQKGGPSPLRWPIQSLAVEGNKTYSKEQILAVAGLKPGQPAGKEQFDAARDRLVANGAFETVGYRFAPSADQTGYVVTFEVSEFEPSYPIRFEGIQGPEPSLKTFLHARDPLFGEKLPATTAVLDRYAKAIQEFAASQGQNEKIVGRITPTGPDQFVIIFGPNRVLPSVAQVSFEGNQVIPTPALQQTVSSGAIGSVYTEGRFREILDASVRPLYETRGRIRVSFPKITVADAKDVKGLLVKVVIEEGPSFDLGDVRVEGNSGVKAEDLLRAANFKTGDLANFEEISKGMQRLRKTLQRNGFMRAEAELERRIDDGKKLVNLIVRVREGPQFTFSKLIIQGLDIHAEAAIKKLWGLKEGKAFNADYPDYFLSRVREDGFFENLKKTSSKIEVRENSNTVDVTLLFQ